MKRELVTVFFILQGIFLSNVGLADSIPRPAPSEFVLGVTPKQFFIERYGETSARDNIYLDGGTQDAKNVTSLVYRPGVFSALFFGGSRPGVFPFKILALQFNDDLLMKYRFISNYEQDATNFDEEKVRLIESGKTTRATVISLLGEPSGMAIYPSAREKNDTRFLYEYVEHDKNERTKLIKRLQIDFNDQNVVKDYEIVVDRLTNVGEERRPYDSYIFVPMPKRK